MLTVPEAAKRVGRDPETVRRWIRAGKLRSRKIGTQLLVEEADLEPFVDDGTRALRSPLWQKTVTGRPPIDWAAVVRRGRQGR